MVAKNLNLQFKHYHNYMNQTKREIFEVYQHVIKEGLKIRVQRLEHHEAIEVKKPTNHAAAAAASLLSA
jgi:hypothetical protein